MGKTAAFYDRDLPRLLFTLYSEGYVIERVGVFLPKLPKGQLIKCFNYGVRRRKTGEKVYFHHAVEAKQPYFMQAIIPVSSPYHTVKKERSREISVGGLYD